MQNFKSLRELSVLDFSINSLLNASAHVFEGLSSLEFLNVSHCNNLENLPSNVFNQLTSLISLDLSDNKLNTMHQDLFCNQSKLVRLSVAGNCLPYLNTYMFDDLEELVHLDLQKNIVPFLQPEDFLNLISLQFLNLSLNSLQIIAANTFNTFSETLQTIDLRDNELLFVSTDSFKVEKNDTCVSKHSQPVYLTCKRMLNKLLLRISMWVLGMSALVFNLIACILFSVCGE